MGFSLKEKGRPAIDAEIIELGAGGSRFRVRGEEF